MARVKKTAPTLDALIFDSPEQKVLRLLLSEPTTAFTPRVISSRLKGVRGLGGGEGINKILGDFEELGFVDFIDNRKAVRLRDDNNFILMLKTVAAICDIEGLKKQIESISTKGVLFGSRSNGRARSDSNYDLYVVSTQPDIVKDIAHKHPLGKLLSMHVYSPDEAENLDDQDPKLALKISKGVQLWGSSW